jgi:hypothetical protein
MATIRAPGEKTNSYQFAMSADPPKTLIALYGGTQLNEANVVFVGHLVDAFLAEPDVVLVTGGFLRALSDAQQHTSVDVATRDAVKRALCNRSDIDARLQRWSSQIPRPGVERFTEGTGRLLPGSDRARRFQLVQGVDGIVTISGSGETTTVIEVALAIGRPVLPIGFSGNDSAEFWKDERERFVDLLGISKDVAARLTIGPASPSEAVALATDVARLVLKAARRRCLVLMGFSGVDNQIFYDAVLKPAIAHAGFQPYRLDRDSLAGNITEAFLAGLAVSHAILVDITALNPNVMYELGHIHQRAGVMPVIVTRDDTPPEQRPFYLRGHTVLEIHDGKEVQKQIGAELSRVRDDLQRRRATQFQSIALPLKPE